MSKDSETQQRPPIERRALSIAETAKTCGLSRATMYRAHRQRQADDAEDRSAAGRYRRRH
jgi:hypothetical protein